MALKLYFLNPRSRHFGLSPRIMSRVRSVASFFLSSANFGPLETEKQAVFSCATSFLFFRAWASLAESRSGRRSRLRQASSTSSRWANIRGSALGSFFFFLPPSP